MRFHRYPMRPHRRQWSPRQIAAARKAVQREQDQVALFPALSRYQHVTDRMAEVDQLRLDRTTDLRSFFAAKWREARRQLAQLPPHTRRGLLRYWNTSACPADPTYLLDTLHALRTQGVSPWSWLRFRHQLKLIGAGRLARPHLNETFERWR